VLWDSIVAGDSHISKMLLDVTALSRSLIEIDVAGTDGRILASSNPDRDGTPLQRREDFSKWAKKGWYGRARDLVKRRPDWEVTVPIGIAGETQPIYTIQVVNSDVFLRDALLPEFQRLAMVSGGALLATLLLTVVTTTRALQPIRRIEQTIDRIAQGKFGDETRGAKESRAAKEFRAMESKLNLLGQKLRGAPPNAPAVRQSPDEMVEQMATELDVASRLVAISKITGGVAHEIKNPLNAIVLRLDLLRETLLDERMRDSEGDLIREIDLVLKEVRRLDRVVKTFLDFSRPVDVRLRDVNLASLAREVAELMTPQGRLAGVAVTFESARPAHMRGDPDMLKQAILNLVANGLDATPPGGSLRLAVNNSGGRVGLDISDTGPGIPAQLRDKVFQLYFTTKAHGSGIGLAMTYRAVQLHNGIIDYTSEAGRGTTFHLEFPATIQHG
jgi:signal transduction histidine kinase